MFSRAEAFRSRCSCSSADTGVGRPSLVLAGWFVAAWQMTLGFTLGLQLFYLLVVLAIGAGIALALRWLPRPRRGVATATLAGGLVFLVVAALMARPYMRVLDAHPEARRTVPYVQSFSPQTTELSRCAGAELAVGWCDVAGPCADCRSSGRDVALPGAHRLAARTRGPSRIGVVSAGCVSVSGSLWCCARCSRSGCVTSTAPGGTPRRSGSSSTSCPGWDGVRTPGRINTLTSLGLALLAGAGLCVIVRWLQGRSPRAATAAGVLGVGFVLLEGLGPLAHPHVPPPPAAVRLEAAPQLNLPAGFLDDLGYSYSSVAGFPLTVNGAGGFDPSGYDELRQEIADFPDRRSVRTLRRLGVRTVLLHPDRAVGTSWEGAASKSTAGLPIERARVGDIIVFRLH